jgi:putative membrane protein insertion efficiency factor
MKTLLIALVRFYQIAIGPTVRSFNGGHGHCRHQPTCSNYALQALRTHGGWRGGWLALRRVLRCHPWGTWGYDPVPPKKDKASVAPSGHACEKGCGCPKGL